MENSYFPPGQIVPQIAATAGALTSLLLQGHLDWRRACVIVLAGECVAFLATGPTATWLKVDPTVFGGILGFGYGIAGMYLCGALMTLLTSFQGDPMGFAKRIFAAMFGDKK